MQKLPESHCVKYCVSAARLDVVPSEKSWRMKSNEGRGETRTQMLSHNARLETFEILKGKTLRGFRLHKR
jgi:hypothetical protein